MWTTVGIHNAKVYVQRIKQTYAHPSHHPLWVTCSGITAGFDSVNIYVTHAKLMFLLNLYGCSIEHNKSTESTEYTNLKTKVSIEVAGTNPSSLKVNWFWRYTSEAVLHKHGDISYNAYGSKYNIEIRQYDIPQPW